MDLTQAASPPPFRRSACRLQPHQGSATPTVWTRGRRSGLTARRLGWCGRRALFAGEGHVDHVFVPAGELRPGGGDLLKSDLDGLRSILEVRLLGVTHVVRQARPKMEGGSITLMSGLYSTRPAPGGGMAAAAVAAVEGMTRALALDLAPIRVNAVAPGLIDTPLWDSFGAQREAILARGARLPVGRIGRPEEVAAAVIFLMNNGFVTGTVLPIDGGGGLV
jgi:NAD(P)-dependent dehydrogenase (short-subunit alcohol dehydrogenase family)